MIFKSKGEVITLEQYVRKVFFWNYVNEDITNPTLTTAEQLGITKETVSRYVNRVPISRPDIVPESKDNKLNLLRPYMRKAS